MRLLSRPIGVVRIRWGGCTTRILLAVRRRRVGRSCKCNSPRLVAMRSRSGAFVAAKVQTHWVKGTQKRRFWLNGSALWRIHCLACWSHANPLAGVGTRYVARNSPATTSTCEIASLELQRFLGISKSDRIKLRGDFCGGGASTVGCQRRSADSREAGHSSGAGSRRIPPRITSGPPHTRS